MLQLTIAPLLIPMMLCACSKGSSPTKPAMSQNGTEPESTVSPDKVEDPPTANTQQTARPTCPTEPELRVWLEKLWQPSSDTQIDMDHTVCAAGLFPEPAFVIVSWIVPADIEDISGKVPFDYRFQLFDSKTGQLLAQHKTQYEDDERLWMSTSSTLAIRDLNGDGIDEVLITEESAMNGGEGMTTLGVMVREDSRFIQAGGFLLADSSDGEGNDYSYTASYKQVTKDGKVTFVVEWETLTERNASYSLERNTLVKRPLNTGK
ncbi:MAG: hypothetical protein JKY56_04815 [Kofleriaceae bacterium]|nr:hypothetical protein [Kofleriaceae bacterium]